MYEPLYKIFILIVYRKRNLLFWRWCAYVCMRELEVCTGRFFKPSPGPSRTHFFFADPARSVEKFNFHLPARPVRKITCHLKARPADRAEYGSRAWPGPVQTSILHRYNNNINFVYDLYVILHTPYWMLKAISFRNELHDLRITSNKNTKWKTVYLTAFT